MPAGDMIEHIVDLVEKKVATLEAADAGNTPAEEMAREATMSTTD